MRLKRAERYRGAQMHGMLWTGLDERAHTREHGRLQVVLSKSIPTQICQLILHISNSKEYVDGFVGELTSAKGL